MNSESDSDRRGSDKGEPENVLNEYDRIQARLGEGFDGDPRLESGVPADQRGSDIEFIQMSGLVRPSAPPPAPAHDDLDASRPVSFFEKGVADVDADMVPGLIEDRATADQEIRPIQHTQAAMSHLREIIADLTKDAPAPDTDPKLMAALDAAEAPAPAEMQPSPVAEVPVPAVDETDAAPKAVTLDDMIAEFGSAHPMQDEVEPIIEAATPPEAEPSRPGATPAPLGESAPPPSTEETPRRAAAPEEPVLTRPAPVLPGHSAQLAEAEKLLDELEPAPASRFEGTEDSGYDETLAVPRTRPAEVDQLPDEALDYKRQGKRRHRTTGKSTIARSLGRLAASLLVVSALAAATYAGYLWIQQRMASPGQLFNQASRLVAKGEYADASRLFEDFASLHPGDPMRAEAQFNAAFAMQMINPSDNDEQQEVTRQALRLFEQYRKDNPAHAKVARAESLMGRLNYESGRYQEAIELLRNPELRLRDPASTVPTLRTLARASAKMGDAEAARSYYLQAVGVQGNYSPDVDYAELGSLYQSRADKAVDLDKRIELQQLAIESWTHALEVPGIDPTSKQTIRSQLDVLRERLQSEPGMAPAMESLDDAAEAMTDAGAEIEDHAEPASDIPAAPSGEMMTTSELPAAAQDLHETPAAPAAPAEPAHGAPAAESHAATGEGEYVVKQGDTLTSIAEAHHVSVHELTELNALKGDTVFEGQHLLVPAPAS
ncbi:MAG: LysM peptidoglycan-binding domain-containing protein [Candidatus Hydrogenedentes bacterium]|nr:LysM peptidoglycan-binding domain-containing protein [Candidatus Hydrogenedentota bacterium]